MEDKVLLAEAYQLVSELNLTIQNCKQGLPDDLRLQRNIDEILRELKKAEEEAGQGFVSGNDWQIMTEEEYQAQQAVKKEENSPFAELQGLFDGDE